MTQLPAVASSNVTASITADAAIATVREDAKQQGLESVLKDNLSPVEKFGPDSPSPVDLSGQYVARAQPKHRLRPRRVHESTEDQVAKLSKTEGGRVARKGPKVLRLVQRHRAFELENKRPKADLANTRTARQMEMILKSAEVEVNGFDDGSRQIVGDNGTNASLSRKLAGDRMVIESGTGSLRRRPIVSPAEAARRNATQKSTDKPNDGLSSTSMKDQLDSTKVWDFSEELAMQLNDMAMKETIQTREKSNITSASGLKYKPKPSPVRMSKNAELTYPHMEDKDTLKYPDEEAADIVYDIFIRENFAQREDPASDIGLRGNADQVGVVVIDDDEELLWDITSDEGSGTEWSSEEDENGMLTLTSPQQHGTDDLGSRRSLRQ